MTMNRGMAFEQRIAEILQKAKIPFKSEVALGGVSPDFLISTPVGHRIVVEAKSWDPKPCNQRRAIQQAKLYKKTTGADLAFVVVQGLKRGRPSEGLVAENELIDVLSTEFQRKELPIGQVVRRPINLMEQFEKLLTESRAKKTIFAAMPFSPEYDDTYLVAMARAAETINAVCKRVDHEKFEGDIVEEIKRLIRESIAVIADLSESKPNVLYETGFAHALERPTIHICSTPLDKLPFDVRNLNTIKYVKGQTYKLQSELIKRLRAALRTT